MADCWENWYCDILARQGNKSTTVQHENFVSLEFERFRIVINPKFKFTLNKTLHHITPKTYYLQFNNNFTPCKSWATFFLIHIPLKYLSECCQGSCTPLKKLIIQTNLKMKGFLFHLTCSFAHTKNPSINLESSKNHK